jgi:hypothetical protein
VPSGNPYSRLREALVTRDLTTALEAADELPQLQVTDALEVLVLMARANDPRFDRAAARWVGRLLIENRIGLRDARFALAMVERLPQCRDALHRLTHQR